MTGTAPIGYFWGDDGYGLDAAAAALGERVAGGPGVPPLTRWRTTGGATRASDIAERVATATLFGGGTLVIVEDAGPLLRSKADRAALEATLAMVAPGNGLVFLEPTGEARSERRPAALQGLQEAVEAAGGETARCAAPREGGMARWIAQRAEERGIRIEPAAAEVLGRRVGAFVREGDVDRRRQGQLAVMELEKLGLYRLDGPVRREDVEALVVEAIPGSTWAFADAVALRRVRDAAEMLDRVLDAVPEPVLLVVLHRRIRELLAFADAIERGQLPQSAARALKLSGYPAEIRASQARGWQTDELEAALDGLLELDGLLKGEGGADARRRRLAFGLWVAEFVTRR
jgi:DNA polymerase III subunit delta